MTFDSDHHTSLSLFEFWPDKIFYTPIVLYWFFMGLRYRDLTISTAANPRIETGGLCGESKSSILDLAGPIAQQVIAPYRVIQNNAQAFEKVLVALDSLEITYPFVLKPDIGCNGTGVKLITSREMLQNVLPLFPTGVTLMVQKLITYPAEVGIFYIRHPDEERGRITSLTYKEAPLLTGDGHSTLKELILQDPRMGQIPQLYLPRIKGRENNILPAGETLSLLFAGNHCKGSIFRNGKQDITPALEERICTIMRDIPDFHFGRIDLKVLSPEALREGRDFQIIEINGVGSEAIHIWDRRTTLAEAYSTQFYHYRQAFLIGAAKKKQGWKSTGLLGTLRSWLKQRRLLASYPTND